MRQIFGMVIVAFLLVGCSGKMVYESAVDLGRYQSDLTLKRTTIDNGLTVAYLENGVKSSKTLVLLHGFSANKDNWLKLAKELNGKYHLIIPDLIGNADSSKPTNIDYSVANQTELLQQFLVKFKDKNMVLVGNSMGGAIALKYASKYKIDSLILLDSMGLQVEESYVDKVGLDKAKKVYLNVCSTKKMKKIIDIAYEKSPYIPNIVLEYLTDIKCKESNLDAYKYSFIIDNKLQVKENLSHKSKSIKIPTLIIWGNKDKIISVQNAYVLHKNIKNSKLIIFDNIGHMPMIEDAKLTASSIERFLEE